MKVNTPAAENPAKSERATQNPPRRDLPPEGSETDQLREKFAQRYQEFFSHPKDTEEEVETVKAILEMAANDFKLCKLIEAIDEKEIPIKEARISCE